jgi:hypothetical protein
MLMCLTLEILNGSGAEPFFQANQPEIECHMLGPRYPRNRPCFRTFSGSRVIAAREYALA